MRRFSVRTRGPLAVALVATLAVLAAHGAPSVGTIPMAPHGDGLYGPAGAPVPLTPTTFLVGVQGPDGIDQSADDEMLLVTDAGGTPNVEAIAIPFRTDWSTATCRLSATRVLTYGAGDNGHFASVEIALVIPADDEIVYLIDRIGSENTVTPIPIGNFDDYGRCQLAALSCTSAAMRTNGPDGARNTADDAVAILTDIGGANTVTHVSAPFTQDSSSRVVTLSPTSFLLGSRGPDATFETADDVTYLFTDVGGTNTRTDLPTPFTFRYSPGQATRLDDSRAVICSLGPDGTYMTADDRLHLLSGLDGPSPAVTPIVLGPIGDRSATRPTLLNDDLLVITSPGPDQTNTTADDQLVILSGIGTTNTITRLTTDFLGNQASSHPVRLSDTSCAFTSAGPNGGYRRNGPGLGLDDEIVIVSGIGGTNTVTLLTVPGLDAGSVSEIVPLSRDAFLVGSGGADGEWLVGADDCVVLVTGVLTTPATQTLDLAGGLDTFGRAFQPCVLGGGRAALTTAGPDNDPEDGGDDQIAILDGLPGTDVRGLRAKKVLIKFKATKPAKPATVLATATLLLDGLRLDGAWTVSIGNAAQTIPGGAFKVSKKGKVKYRDRKRRNGWISSLAFNPKNGKLVIKGKGLGTAVESTAPGHIVLAVADTNRTYFSDSFAGTVYGKGIKYKAP